MRSLSDTRRVKRRVGPKRSYAASARRFWSASVTPGSASVAVKVAPGEVLRLTRAGPHSLPCSLTLLVWAEGGQAPCSRLALEPGGTTLDVRLPGLPRADRWRLEMTAGPGQNEELNIGTVSLLGYFSAGLLLKRGCSRQVTQAKDHQCAPKIHSPATDVRAVQLPAGWAGISFREAANGQLTVTEVPKACYSSAAFGRTAAAQVSDVAVGDTIVSINGMSPGELADNICRAGHSLNWCSRATPPHQPGTIGKLALPPCLSCDFVRRRRDSGLDVALQLWIRAVKRDMPITLGVRSHSVPRDAGMKLEVHDEADAARALAPAGRPTQTTHGSSDFVPYNPLRPAASKVSSTNGAVARPAPKVDAKPKVGPLIKVGGLAYEELGKGSGSGTPVRDGQAVEIKVALRLASKPTQVVERGEICCRIGHGEVDDGWVDGNVDLEDVLASWSRCIVGMLPGDSRRVHVPPKMGFRGGGGEVVPSGAALLFDVILKRLV